MLAKFSGGGRGPSYDTKYIFRKTKFIGIDGS